MSIRHEYDYDCLHTAAACELSYNKYLYAGRYGKRQLTNPDLNFWGIGELIAEGDYVAGRQNGGPASAIYPSVRYRKRTMRLTGTTVFRIENGKIAEVIGE